MEKKDDQIVGDEEKIIRKEFKSLLDYISGRKMTGITILNLFANGIAYFTDQFNCSDEEVKNINDLIERVKLANKKRRDKKEIQD